MLYAHCLTLVEAGGLFGTVDMLVLHAILLASAQAAGQMCMRIHRRLSCITQGGD